LGKRRKREQQFTSNVTFAIFTFAQDLINSAFVLLQCAFNERKNQETGIPGGHYSIHAPSSIVLICTAFDQWLNQSALTLDVRYEGLRTIAAKHDTIIKYKKFGEIISGNPFNISDDLQMAWDVRNEIVHWLPRKAAEGSNWPEWLSELQDRGLVLSSRVPSGDDLTDLATKLHSYSLARWVWKTLAIAGDELLAQFADEDEIERNTIDWSVEGLHLYQQLPE